MRNSHFLFFFCKISVSQAVGEVARTTVQVGHHLPDRIKKLLYTNIIANNKFCKLETVACVPLLYHIILEVIIIISSWENILY